MDAQLNEIDAVFLDLDGTIYLGGDLIEGSRGVSPTLHRTRCAPIFFVQQLVQIC